MTLFTVGLQVTIASYKFTMSTRSAAVVGRDDAVLFGRPTRSTSASNDHMTRADGDHITSMVNSGNEVSAFPLSLSLSLSQLTCSAT